MSGLLSGQVEYYETPTSGGKAHAIYLLSKNSESSSTVDQESLSVPAESAWIVLTDDACTQTPEPYASVRTLEWDGWGTGEIREVASYAGTEMQGGSHAVFLHVHADVEEVVQHNELWSDQWCRICSDQLRSFDFELGRTHLSPSLRMNRENATARLN